MIYYFYTMDFKAISENFKDVDVKQGIVTGYLAHFGSKDADGDVIMEGSFTKSVSENGPEGTKRIKYLLDHKTDNAVGVFQQLKEDTNGLYYEAKIGRHQAGRDYLLMVEDEIINQHSIGFKRIKQEVKSDAKYIKEIRLYEGSGLQFWAANGNTPITGIKEMDMQGMISHLSMLNQGLKDGKYSDETMIMIGNEIQQINNSLNTLKAASSTLIDDQPNILTGLINVLSKN